MSRNILIFVLLIASLSSGASAERREHHAHEHGHGEMMIVLDHEFLNIELELPGIDTVGFEHAPKSEDDKKKVNEALAIINSDKLFSFIPEGSCWTKGEIKVESSLITGSAHQHEEQVENDLHEKHDEHAAFRAEYGFTCKVVDALKFEGFAKFPSLKELAVSLVIDNAQSKFELSPEKTTAYFRVKN